MLSFHIHVISTYCRLPFSENRICLETMFCTTYEMWNNTNIGLRASYPLHISNPCTIWAERAHSGCHLWCLHRSNVADTTAKWQSPVNGWSSSPWELGWGWNLHGCSRIMGSNFCILILINLWILDRKGVHELSWFLRQRQKTATSAWGYGLEIISILGIHHSICAWKHSKRSSYMQQTQTLQFVSVHCSSSGC